MASTRRSPFPPGFCGSVKRSSARSRSGLNTMIGTPRREASCKVPHHARMVRARIVSHRDDEFAMLEIVERDGAFTGYQWTSVNRHWWPRDTYSSSPGNCLCRIRARRVGRGRQLRWRRGPRCRTPPCSDPAEHEGSPRCGRMPDPSRWAGRCRWRHDRPTVGSDDLGSPAHNRSIRAGPTPYGGKEFRRYSLLSCFPSNAFAPFSQNWKVEVCSLSGHAQPGQSNPVGLLVRYSSSGDSWTFICSRTRAL